MNANRRDRGCPNRQGPLCLCFAPAMPSPLRDFEILPQMRQMHSPKVRANDQPHIEGEPRVPPAVSRILRDTSCTPVGRCGPQRRRFEEGFTAKLGRSPRDAVKKGSWMTNRQGPLSQRSAQMRTDRGWRQMERLVDEGAVLGFSRKLNVSSLAVPL
jgi:hypothetical protein